MLQETAVYTQIHTTSRFISREHVCTRIYTYTYIHICTARFESGLFQEAIGVCSHIPTANFFFPGSRVYGQPGSFQVCSRKQDVCTQPGSSQVCYMKHDINNNNNNRRLVTLAEHTSDHGRQTNSSTEEKGEQV